MALNSNALTTTEQVIKAIKTYPFLPDSLSFDDADVVEEVERLINQWSSTIQHAVRRELGFRQYVEILPGSIGAGLTLKNYPIKEIVSIERIDSNGDVVEELDLVKMLKFLSEDDLKSGIIYLEPNFARRMTGVGLIPEPFHSLKAYKVTYKAGFILPKDATLEAPSDLPADLEGLVVDLVKTMFVDETDTMRANGLITLTEGNVQRMWGQPAQFTLSKIQEKIIASYKRMSV